MPVYVNLPLSFAHRTPSYIDMFIKRGVHPELGMDTYAVQALPEEWHKATAARFHNAGITCAIHLPFFDLSPGSMNNAILSATRATLQRATELALIYSPAHLIGHPHYNKGEHEPYMARWLKRATETWTMILDSIPGIPLFLENTFERSPHAILHLLEHLPANRTSFCLDIGHWHSFAGGFRKQDLAAWLTAIGNRLGHLHLHDNDGSEDQHIGLGAGTIPLNAFFETLRINKIRPTATLEPHDEGAFETSLAYLKEHNILSSTLNI